MLLATSEYNAKNALGESVPFVLVLHLPEQDPLSDCGDYRCKVEIQGISFEEYAYGIDSLQALCLAVETLRITIGMLQSDGWSFYFPKYPDLPFDLAKAYFPMTALH